MVVYLYRFSQFQRLVLLHIVFEFISSDVVVQRPGFFNAHQRKFEGVDEDLDRGYLIAGKNDLSAYLLVHQL